MILGLAISIDESPTQIVKFGLDLDQRVSRLTLISLTRLCSAKLNSAELGVLLS